MTVCSRWHVIFGSDPGKVEFVAFNIISSSVVKATCDAIFPRDKLYFSLCLPTNYYFRKPFNFYLIISCL